MARAMHPDSAGSQFFIMHEKSPHLDGAYAAFGKIIEGMDVVNKNCRNCYRLQRPSAARTENEESNCRTVWGNV